MKLADSIHRCGRYAFTTAVLMAALFVSTAVYAQSNYPSKTVTLLVAWNAGGASDLLARAIQPALAKQLGTNVVIKNAAGAAGTIGTARAARAAPDGYTVLLGPAGPVAIQPHLRQLPYKLSSFRAVTRIAISPMLMMVRPDSKYNSVKDLVNDAHQHPGKIAFGSVGAGSLPDLAIIAFSKAANVKLKHVPFSGSARAVKALLGGTISVFDDQAQLAPQYNLKKLAAWSTKRLKQFPDVPTLKEAGYDVHLVNWEGVFVPAKTPDSVVKKLNSALQAAFGNKDVQKSMHNLHVIPAPLGPKAFGKFARQSSDKSKALLNNAGLSG